MTKDRGILMKTTRFITVGFTVLALVALTACGNRDRASGADSAEGQTQSRPESIRRTDGSRVQGGTDLRKVVRDVFNTADPNVTLEVNKYIWNASLDVLNFLPIEAADPFTGVFVTGYGTPPGGGQAYRATVYITDPALDARSLNVAVQTRGGRAVDPDTVRAIEDAILTRARQLRIREGKL